MNDTATITANCENCGSAVLPNDDPDRVAFANNGDKERFCCPQCADDSFDRECDKRIHAINHQRGILSVFYFVPAYLSFCWFWNRIYYASYPIENWKIVNWTTFLLSTLLAVMYTYRTQFSIISDSVRLWPSDFMRSLFIGFIPFCLIGFRLDWNLVFKVIGGLCIILLIPWRLLRRLAASILLASITSISVLFTCKWPPKIIDIIFQI